MSGTPLRRPPTEKKLVLPGQIQSSECSHLDLIQAVTPSSSSPSSRGRIGYVVI